MPIMRLTVLGAAGRIRPPGRGAGGGEGARRDGARTVRCRPGRPSPGRPHLWL